MGNDVKFLLGERHGEDSEYLAIAPSKIVGGALIKEFCPEVKFR